MQHEETYSGEHYIRPFDLADKIVMHGSFAAVIALIVIVLVEGVFP